MSQLVQSILSIPYEDLYEHNDNPYVRELFLHSMYWKLYESSRNRKKIEIINSQGMDDELERRRFRSVYESLALSASLRGTGEDRGWFQTRPTDESMTGFEVCTSCSTNWKIGG